MSWDWTLPAEPVKDARCFRAANSRCVIRLRADLHEALHLSQAQTRNVVQEMVGSVKARVGSTVSYAITNKLNQFAIGEIVRVGEPAHGDEPLALKAGEIVGFDLGQVSHQLKKQHVLLQWAALLCVFRAESEYPIPLADHVMTRLDAEVQDRFAFSGSKVRLHAPRRGPSSVPKTNDMPHSRVGCVCDVVIDSGPGKKVRTRLLPNGGLQRDDWVIYTPGAQVDLLFRRGETLRFVPWDKIEGVISERDPYAEG